MGPIGIQWATIQKCRWDCVCSVCVCVWCVWCVCNFFTVYKERMNRTSPGLSCVRLTSGRALPFLSARPRLRPGVVLPFPVRLGSALTPVRPTRSLSLLLSLSVAPPVPCLDFVLCSTGRQVEHTAAATPPPLTRNKFFPFVRSKKTLENASGFLCCAIIRLRDSPLCRLCSPDSLCKKRKKGKEKTRNERKL